MNMGSKKKKNHLSDHTQWN